MNNLYFRCEDCKRYLDAGYRWAYCTLVEPGIVAEDDFIEGGSSLPILSASTVLGTSEYWQVPDDNKALAAQLGRVRAFLLAHSDHRLSFGDLHRFEGEWFEWLCEDEGSNLLPRYLIEVHGFTRWGQVQEFMKRRKDPPWWWRNRVDRVAARRRFEELAQGVRGR